MGALCVGCWRSRWCWRRLSREEAAERGGMDRQALRDWLHRYNAEGIPGLTSRPGGSPPSALTEQQMAELNALIIEGPAIMVTISVTPQSRSLTPAAMAGEHRNDQWLRVKL